jgi:hypothetical protein
MDGQFTADSADAARSFVTGRNTGNAVVPLLDQPYHFLEAA